jgi:dTDP-4-dehydrorhamnose reductase
MITTFTAEKMKNEGKSSLVWKINVEATQVIVEEAKRSGKNVLYLSTDYVFNGTDESYTEQSMPKPESFYALSKYEGEEAIKQLGDAGLIVRTANPYRNKPCKNHLKFSILKNLTVKQMLSKVLV